MTLPMDDLSGLTPEQMELLALLLDEGGVDLASQPIAPRKQPGASAPLSFSQQRLWFLDQLEPGSPMYNMPAAARLRGTLSVPALQAALDEIVARHEVLRTVFAPAEGGEAIQRVLPEVHLPIHSADLSALPAEAREPELMRLAVAEAQAPFDLARGPLVRVTLLGLAGDDYLLLLNMHHIVTDGWSIGVFLRELGETYAALVAGQPAPLPPLPLQYGDYALWQRETLQGAALDRQLDFWRNTLQDAPAVLELPFDRPRPAVQTYDGAAVEFVVPASLQAKLNELAHRESATLFMTLLSAFQVLLYRYSRQADISVGTPIANRTRSELEGLIGFFANTLVIRGQLAPQQPFREFLARVRETTLAAYEHQDVPFEQVVEAAQPERTLSYAPLFQVMFVLQNTPQQARRLPGLSLSPVRFPSITAKFDITLNMSERPDGIEGSIEYNTGLFDAATIERFVGHFLNLCAAIVAQPDCPVGLLPLLAPAERQQLLGTWNATATPVDLDRRIHDLVEAQVDRTPDAVAIVFEDRRLTYGQLDRRANQLAHHLRGLGVGVESLVGVCMERTPELIVALLGILKAGAAYVPMDPRYPTERLEFMAEDARVAALVTDSRSMAAAPANAPCVVDMDRDRALLDAQPAVRQHSGAGSGNLSYVLFTSGSTGRPKGVAIQHRSAIAMISWAQRVFPAESLAAVLASTSISFDLSVYEIFVTLSAGGRLVLVENALGLLNNPSVDGVTLINTVPSAAAELLRLDGIPRSVRTINLAGEPLSQQLVAQLYGLQWVEDVYDLYGPTEDTTYSTFTRRAVDGVATIGRPVDNSQAYLLDPFLQPVPQGVAGEIYLGGAGLARGYLNRPDLTAERFVPDPFSAVHGSRLYRTGDLGRYLPDGAIQYLGRIDHQVKIRGFRIELGEIEKAIESCDGVARALVTVREDVPGNKQLVAYVERRLGATEGLAGLRATLTRRLPSHMMPAVFVDVDTWPLTPNGKIDRRRLPVPDAPSAEESYVLPRTPTEEVLAGIWAHLLGAARVGRDDNFFALGGHSLSATQLVSRVRSAFRVELPLRRLFETPTVGGLAATVDRLCAEASAGVAPPIARVARESDEQGRVRLPLSFAQQRLWFIDQLEPNSSLYNIPSAVRLTGDLDLSALRQALDALAVRHESLRTTFETVDGKARQVISPASELALDLVDLSGIDPAEREPEMLRRARAEAQKPFDLAAGPLSRLTLLRLHEQDHALLIVMHHIISDGWSIGVVIREFGQLYAAYAAGQAPALPPLPLQYGDYAAWQRGWLEATGEAAEHGVDAGTPLERQLAYWREQLAGAPSLLELPADRPRPAVQTNRGASVAFALDAALAGAVAALSRAEGATPFMTLIAAFQAVLSRLSGQRDVLVGTPVANRTRAELEGTVGFFVNTLVLRADLSGRPSFRELFGRVRTAALGAYAHQDVPFEKLVDALNTQRNMTHTPLFQVMFTLQNAAAGEMRLPNLTLAPQAIHGGTTPFDLTLSLATGSEGITGWLEYSTDIFDEDTARRFVRYFETLLRGIVAEPDRPLALLEIMPEDERRMIVETWNATDFPIPAVCLHQAFEAQARRTPDELALIFTGDGESSLRVELTYSELDRRADAVAAELLRLGVRKEQIVAISVEKSAEQVVGLLGALKAGAVYLPLDPAYPADRIDFILADSDAKVLLTQSSLLDRFDRAGVPQVICLDRFDAGPGDGAPCRVALSPDNLAYIIYTSGSTGRPKGVLVQHRGAVSMTEHYIRAIGLGPGKRTLQFTSFSFDASLLEMFAPLFSGSTLYLAPRSLISDPETLLRVLEDQKIDFTVIPPAMLATLPTPGHYPGLLITGGEACPPELAARWLPGRRFFNGYGPTEATIAPTLHEVVDLDADRQNVSIGRPIANARVYVLDQDMQPVPPLVVGQVYLGGVCVARGYLGRPELTAERFVPNPLLSSGGAPFSESRLYPTGDLGRFRKNGDVEYLGRVDFQVKVRGYRIELGEIEAALLEHPAIQECAVLARDDGGGKRLVAYFTSAGNASPPVGELRAFLGTVLPEYMVPAVFVTLDSLPITAHGKIDRRALPAPDVAGRADTGTEFIPPATPNELALAQIWSRVLGVADVSAHDNFFELGGDSILSIQVISRANQAGLHLTPKQLFQAPTLAALAALAGGAVAGGAEQGPVEGAVPLTPIQRRFFDLELADRNHWNQSILLSVAGALAPASLAAAVEALVEHHDALRLRFSLSDSAWQARNAGPGEVSAPSFEYVDLASLDPAGFSAAVERHAAQTQASLELSEGPLFRVVYYDAGPVERGRLLLVGHHLVVDGVSWRILLEDLQAAYAQHAQTGALRLPPKTVSFKTWAEKLTAYASGDAVRGELDAWLDLVTGWVPPLPLDATCEPAENTEDRAAQAGALLTAEETEMLLSRSGAAYNTETQELLLCALAQTIEKWTGAPTLYVDLEGHGREEIGEEVDVSRTVGWFTSLYPVRLDLPWSAGPGEAIVAVKEQLRRIPQRGLGYGLLRYLGPADAIATLAAAPEPEITFNYLGQFDHVLRPAAPAPAATGVDVGGSGGAAGLGPAPETAGRDRADANRRTHLLDVTAAVAGGRLSVSWTYNRSAHDAATIQQLADWYVEALAALIAHCVSPEAGAYSPSDFPLAELDQRQLDKVLKKVTRTENTRSENAASENAPS